MADLGLPHETGAAEFARPHAQLQADVHHLVVVHVQAGGELVHLAGLALEHQVVWLFLTLQAVGDGLERPRSVQHREHLLDIVLVIEHVARQVHGVEQETLLPLGNALDPYLPDQHIAFVEVHGMTRRTRGRYARLCAHAGRDGLEGLLVLQGQLIAGVDDVCPG